jgi:hypothetical protein
MQDLRNRANGAVRKFCRSAEAGSSEISVVVERGRGGKSEGLEFSPFWRVAFEVGVDGVAEF